MSGLGLLSSLLLSVSLAASPNLPPDAAAPEGGVSSADAGTDASDGGAIDATTPVVPPAAPPPIEAPPRLGPIVGRVLEKGTRRPVIGAVVAIDLVAAGESDDRGRFAAVGPCGPRHVVVQAPGFEPLGFERDPCADASPLLLRLVRRPGGRVFESVVRAQASLPSIKLEGPELTKTPGSLGDPFRTIESLPGVSVVAWPAPIYAVRGANPGNTGFFLDDLSIPSLFHLALGPAVVHPYFIDSLDFYPGGYPARYGRYVSGIVTAETREPPADMVHGSVDVRLFDAGALVSGPLPGGQGTVVAAARYSYTGTVISLLSNAVQLSYWDYQLRADRNFGPVHLTLLAFGSSDFLSSTGSNAAANELELRFHRVGLRASLPVDGGLLSAGLAFGADHTRSPLSNTYPLTIEDTSLFPRLSFRRRLPHLDLQLGVDGELQHFDALTTIQRPMVLDLARARDARLLAAYASLAVRPTQRLVVTPELRLDTYEVSGVEKADLGPRLSARVEVDDKTWLVAAGGRFTQTPSLPLQIPGAESFGLALYGLQSSWQGSLGVGTKRYLGLEANLTGYLQRYVLTDIRDPSFSTSIDPLADDFLVRRDALSYGFEVLVRRPPSERLYGWLSYTLSWNLRAFGGGVIGPSDWDQRHVLNLVLGYRLGRYSVGGRAHYNTGRPVLVGGDFQRLPPFYQIDLRADRRFVFNRFSMEVYLELVNATLDREVVSLQTTGIGPPVQNSYLIVLPSIGVHAEF